MRDAETLAARFVLPCASPLAHVRFSPDGSHVCGVPRAAGAALPVWTVDDGAFAASIQEGDRVAHARWAPDSRTVLLCVRGHGRACLRSLRRG